MAQVRPGEQMRNLGVVQNGAPVLAKPARTFGLSADREAAEKTIEQLHHAMEGIGQVHPLVMGKGMAAPRIGIGRAVALVQPPEPDTSTTVLLNPRITDWSSDGDQQYEGCVSFFDVRGRVPRPLRITVKTTRLDGRMATATYHRGLARLIHHEIDHLDGLLYTARLRTGIAPIPVGEYRQTGQSWAYRQ
ncbi:peptide deformylase [Streptomyces microflavus]|uniref:peptide deformylase n=1 Tax=Streptomyces microflavus TaxID=1919 RepID=UPI003696F79F